MKDRVLRVLLLQADTMVKKSSKPARTYFPHLQVLAKEAGNTKRRKALLQSADPKLIKTIAECCHNGMQALPI